MDEQEFLQAVIATAKTAQEAIRIAPYSHWPESPCHCFVCIAGNMARAAQEEAERRLKEQDNDL